jgi:hypothetical protein
MGQLRCPKGAFARIFVHRLNLFKGPVTHTSGLRGPEEVLMTKHRTITGSVIVTLLAVAATVGVMRSHSPSTDRTVVAAGNLSVVDANKLPTEEYDDQSLVFSSKRPE